MVALVGVVGQAVVLKAVDDRVVVHVHAKEKLRRIDLIAEERLDVIRAAVLVLVEVGDKIVVLVQPGKNLSVAAHRATLAAEPLALAIALPVGEAVLVIVVIDKLKEVLGLAGVVDNPARVGDKGRGAVIGIYGEHLAVREEGVALVRSRDVPGFGRLLVGGQLAEVLVGEATEAAVESPFGPQVEVGEVNKLQIHADHFVPGRQAVGKAHKGLVGAIGDLVARLGHRQENLLAPGIGLEIGGDLYAVVVGHHQLEFELLGLAEGAHFFGWAKIVANVVDKLKYVRAAHL